MEKLGHKVNEEELKEIFARYDIDQTGDITFQEFKLVFENMSWTYKIIHSIVILIDNLCKEFIC